MQKNFTFFAALTLIVIAGLRVSFLPLPAFAAGNAAQAMHDARIWSDAKLSGKASKAVDALPPFSFTYGGKPSGDLLTHWHVQRTSAKLDAHRQQRVTLYTDPVTGLEVRCVGVQYSDYPAVEWTLSFKNNSKADTPILENIQALDTRFPSAAGTSNTLHWFDGGFQGVDAYQPHAVALTGGDAHQSFAPGGRGSDRYLPYFNLDSGSGGVIIAIGWPGQWKMECNPGDTIRVGQELTHFTLHPGEQVRSPLIALQFWHGGDWIDAQNVWRRWMIADNMPTQQGKPLPPMLAGASSPYYNWMTNADEKSQLLFIDKFLAEGLKLDYWWMDAGWYPNTGDWVNTGTWEVDMKRFPGGLRAISDHAHAKGVKTIVWFEPERVTAGSWLWNTHPDWLLGADNGWKLLDLGNPIAHFWLTNYIDKMLTAQGIDIYRQDYNINPLGYWRGHDASDRQGITEIRYIEGYLSFWDELRRRHPGLLIDSCSSGGRRNDLETMRRAVPLWRDDDTGNALDDQGHTYGFSLWVPYQGSETFMDPYRFRSALLWSMNIHPDARDPNTNFTEARTSADQWRQVAPYVLGDFYPLTAYSLADNVWMAWQYNRPEQGDGMVQAFRRAGCPDGTVVVKLRGLTPTAHYRLTDMDSHEAHELTGRQLMEDGLTVTSADKPRAIIMEYKRLPHAGNATASRE